MGQSSGPVKARTLSSAVLPSTTGTSPDPSGAADAIANSSVCEGAETGEMEAAGSAGGEAARGTYLRIEVAGQMVKPSLYMKINLGRGSVLSGSRAPSLVPARKPSSCKAIAVLKAAIEKEKRRRKGRTLGDEREEEVRRAGKRGKQKEPTSTR